MVVEVELIVQKNATWCSQGAHLEILTYDIHLGAVHIWFRIREKGTNVLAKYELWIFF